MSETINVNVGIPLPGTNATVNINVQGAGQPGATAPTGGGVPALDLPTATQAVPAAGAVSTDQSTAASAVNWQTQNVDIDKISVDEFKALDGMMQEFMSDGQVTQSEMQTYEQTRAFYASGGAAPAPAGGAAPAAPADGFVPFSSQSPAAPTGGSAPTPAPVDAWSHGDTPLNDNERNFSSVGDPHETTGDGTKFDNELTGDFVKLKSASGDFELETRQEHDDKGRWAGKTLNKMAAVKSGPDTVVYNGDGPGPHSLTINGQNMPLTPGKTYALSGGGSVTVNKDGVKIVSAAGDEVNIKQQDQYIDITGQLSAKRKDGEVRGSLGNFHNDGNKAEDFMGPDGKQYTNVQDFENAWRAGSGDQLLPASGAGAPTGGGVPTGGGLPNNAAIVAELAQMAQEITQLTQEMTQLTNEFQNANKPAQPTGGGAPAPAPVKPAAPQPHHRNRLQREERELKHIERETARLQREIEQQQKK